ncbi:hypothetical protein OGAPHI_001631 [Ogataea philodendri]|uniref:ERT1/acuK family PAS domain-containing protein n=1 Tax=Ogataea philodendri TaxID=1378263 RepID=A0A9P8PD60_9ASCO|nr:uncharacterized protein OGAPHI_001631 [Ogataea philodendri]KAH3669510.1 hypothetical protein OGAPHI_001631 [Ogataea philodendri]
MTCDDARPCSRCVAKGTADTCADAPRKTKKYLTGETPGDGMGATVLETRKPFMSSAADMEYSTLGNIINQDFLSPETQQSTQFFSPAVSNSNSEDQLDRVAQQTPIYQAPSQQLFSPEPSLMPIYKLESLKTNCDPLINQYYIGAQSTFPQIVKMISQFRQQNPAQFHERNQLSAISFSVAVPQSNDRLPTKMPCGLLFKEPSEIYSKIAAPFNYVKPYHDLNLYLRKRFDKSHLVSMSKSMSEYRPSFIAGMIHLKGDDLIFAEQCFQRTLLEYDNYISISGTPTLVWRRTSQIAYVGDEFCVLTGWSKEQLLDKSVFAVEIMDDKSCVEYFQLFSKIAFGDFRGATMTECTLLTPAGDTIRVSSIWTLKRDVFGIPMMIIASFLPILT